MHSYHCSISLAIMKESPTSSQWARLMSIQVSLYWECFLITRESTASINIHKPKQKVLVKVNKPEIKLKPKFKFKNYWWTRVTSDSLQERKSASQRVLLD